MLLEPELLHGEACVDPLDPDYLIDVRTGRRFRRVRGASDWPSSGVTLAGKLGIATAQSTSSTSYTLLTTPDKVPIFLPQDGLIVVAYQALWQNTVANNARAAIFIGTNQQKIVPSGGGTPGVIEAVGPGATNSDAALSSTPIGLQGNSNANTTTEVTTGQVVSPSSNVAVVSSGPAFIFAAAGTYDVSIQYRNNGAGTLTASKRHLWVWVIG